MEKIYVKKKEKTHTLLIFLSSWTSTTNMCYVKIQPICSSSIVPQTHYYSKHLKHVFFCSFHNNPLIFFYQTKVFKPHNAIPLAILSNHRLHHIDSFIFLSNHTLPTPTNWFYKRTICMALPCSKKAKTFTSHVLDFFRFLCASKPICITYLSLPF